MNVEHKPLHVPELSELAQVIKKGLEGNYETSSCSVVSCPDLSEAPFGLAAAGICGKTRLADVGGVPYLIPTNQHKTKIYDLQKVSEQVDLPGCFILGAGAGSKQITGSNCEMISNFRTDGGEQERKNLTHVSKVNVTDTTKHYLESYEENYKSSCQFGLLANLFCSEGKRGDVIEVRAKTRTGAKDLIGCIRNAMKDHYGDSKPVGLGGTFLIKSGSIKIHVMPDFSLSPLNSDDDVNNWLKFYEANSPFVCMATCITADCGLDLRVEHTHGYSKVNGAGGHYHCDTTPAEIEYTGYFSPAEFIYRIDRPSVTHQIGRD